MTLKASTGLRNALLDTGPLKTAMDLGFIHIYAGAVPSSADDSLGAAVLLCTLSAGGIGTGLTFESTAVDGALWKNSAETWAGTNVAGGVAAFYRHVAPGDTGASSTLQARIQGAIAVSGSDMNMTAGTTLVNGAPNLLNSYFVNLPTL